MKLTYKLCTELILFILFIVSFLLAGADSNNIIMFYVSKGLALMSMCIFIFLLYLYNKNFTQRYKFKYIDKVVWKV
jgi:hypothetical protein